MKRVLTYTIIILSITAFNISLNAQVKIGIRSAINFSTWNAYENENVNTIKNVIGFALSSYADIKVLEDLSLQTELQYIQKGYKGINNNTASSVTLKLSYIQLPLHAKFNFGNEDNSGFILAGPFVGLMLGGNKNICPIGMECYDRKTTLFDRNPQYERLDYGLSFGGGVKIKNQYVVDLRYTIGLFSPGGGISISKSENKGLQIGLAYIFGRNDNLGK